MSIPKIIHYVWVGNKEKPPGIVRCMKTWEKHLSDYKIIEWNEKNFDINAHPFVKKAYEMKKYAFVSDYIRAFAIHEMGGIYLDTDVLVLENLDKFRIHKAFVGFENPEYPFTAVFGAEKGHPLIKDMLKLYEGKEFQFDKNDQMAEVNTKTVSEILVNQYGCKVNNKYQELEKGIAVYPDTVLCNPSKDSSTIHVFTGTWREDRRPMMVKLNKLIKVRLTSKRRAHLYQKLVRV